MNNTKFLPKYTVTQFSEKKNDTLLIIPVLNEAHRIQNQLIEFSNLNLNVDLLIADGGSTDDSLKRDFLEKTKINFLVHEISPTGLGRQLICAFDFATHNKYKFAITMDGNNKDDFISIDYILAELTKGIEFVQVSRFIADGKAINTPRARLIALRLIHSPLTSIASKRKFTDTTNGFRGFNILALNDPKINIYREIFHSYELLAYLPIRICKLGYRSVEVPGVRAYPKSEATPTKIKGLKGNLKILLILLKAALGRFNPK